MESPRAAKHLFFLLPFFIPFRQKSQRERFPSAPRPSRADGGEQTRPLALRPQPTAAAPISPPSGLRGRGAESPPGVGSAGDGVHISAFKGKNAGSERSPLSSILRVRGISPPGGAAGPGFGCRSAQGWFWHSNLPPSPRPPGCSVPFDLASGSIQRQEEKMLLRGQSVF